MSLRHQYWPSILPGGCATPETVPGACNTAVLTGGGFTPGVKDSYQLFSLAGSYRFGDKYTLRMGIDNLLDELPPVTGANPLQQPFANPGTRLAGFAPATLLGTYDPLGRRGFVSLTMEF